MHILRLVHPLTAIRHHRSRRAWRARAQRHVEIERARVAVETARKAYEEARARTAEMARDLDTTLDDMAAEFAEEEAALRRLGMAQGDLE